jgi:uncharacterized membrane protein YidH (DUF202 family)
LVIENFPGAEILGISIWLDDQMENKSFVSRQRLARYLQIPQEEYRLKFEKLIAEGIITEEKLEGIIEGSISSLKRPEELLIAGGIPKHGILRSLSEYYGLPWVEYSESLLPGDEVIGRLDLERLKETLWFPLSVSENSADVIVCDPDDPALTEEIQRTLKVERINKFISLPADLIRIIENNQDVNPNFPPSAGRTPLARVRTYLAEQRTQMAWYRTSMAKARTGLAFIRTGMSFISIALVLLMVFGIGYAIVPEMVLLGVGLLMTIDGVMSLPPRRMAKRRFDCQPTESTFGTTLLELTSSGDHPRVTRTGTVEGAAQLRDSWNRLSPLMKRRFLAIDRTDMAEERTILASYRTIMSRARTGLAFTRTGIASIGLGIALLRQFALGPWALFDSALIFSGTILTFEGFYWSFAGRHAAIESLKEMKIIERKTSIWEFMFPPLNKRINPSDLPSTLFIQGSPGIWGTTGLALERTLIAERRNVKARLRTIMARSRTGLALIRTGISIFSVGAGLLFYFGTGNVFWTVFNLILMATGAFLIGDGFYWHIPAEKIRKQFPYCFADMEITLPDYGKPASLWKKVVFSHDNS